MAVKVCQAGKFKQPIKSLLNGQATYLLRFNDHRDVSICKALNIYVGTFQLVCSKLPAEKLGILRENISYWLKTMKLKTQQILSTARDSLYISTRWVVNVITFKNPSFIS